MQALKFELSGKTAFFKKPDVNSYIYFTYGNIHKIALLGILGGILGLDGYMFQQDKIYPEFYSKLSDLMISIVPKSKEGFISKKVQTFNNSVGYASKEQGGNLIINEQWLEEPKWDIYILLEDKEYIDELKDRLLFNKYKYIPYLGKNDHFASIKYVEVVNLEELQDVIKIDSLFIKKYFSILNSNEDDSSNLNQILNNVSDNKKWKYEEKLPIRLGKNTNQYELESFVFTNMKVKNKDKTSLYSYKDKTLFFF